MLEYLLAVAVIVIVMLGWIGVQQAARRFARRHPQFGPAREEGSGCGKGCCSAGCCGRDKIEATVSGGEHDTFE